MEFMTFFRFKQIKQYLHMSPPITTRWYMKLEPLASQLCTKFQNVSFDEMMVPFSRRSKHTLKMKNKPISEGFKIWALCDYGYLWDFFFYSCTSSELIHISL